MVGVVALPPGHDGPQNSRVLVRQGDRRFLPATTLAQLLSPLRDSVVVVLAGKNGRLGTLYQQAAQVVIAAFGDAAQIGVLRPNRRKFQISRSSPAKMASRSIGVRLSRNA